MTQTTIPVATLVVITLIGMACLRRLPGKIRAIFDGLCFIAISSYFFWQKILPVFPPLDGNWDTRALWLRMIGGAWWLFGARLIVTMLGLTLHRDRQSRETRLFSDLFAASIYIATGLIVLSSVFALPVTGVVATSGVVAIVLGLALQNTLADVFAGIAVGIERPFGVGDRIQLGDRLEGIVVQANWRSIRLQTDGDDIAIIPNSIVAKAEIVNRSFPSQRRADCIELSCPANAMPERVIETLTHATLLCPDILVYPGPAVMVARIGSGRNLYKISFHVAATKALSGTKDQLLRVARRHLHYAGLLDIHDITGPLPRDLSDDAIICRRLLQDIVLFEYLDTDQITELARRVARRRLEPGELLFTQGQVDKSLYLVASGVIEILRQAGDTTESLGLIGAGEYLGEIGLLTGAAHAVTVKARTHCKIYQLPHDALGPLLEHNADLVAAFEKSVRKGLDILHREVATRAAPDIGTPGQLLTRIRHFLGMDPI